jgi:hypothetical protein
MKVLLILALAAIPAEAKIFPLGNAAGPPEVIRQETVREGGKTVEVRFHLSQLKTKRRAGYSTVILGALPLTSEVGLPALPFQAVTVDAAAAEIRVNAELGEPVSVSVGRVRPAQIPACRCAEAPKSQAFVDHVSDFSAAPSGFRVESLGDFRGQSVSRVLLFPHRYDPATGALFVYPNARFVISYEASAPAVKVASTYDYLVIAPRELVATLNPWLNWKRSQQNLRFSVVAYEDLGSPKADDLKSWIHAEYARAQFKYALIVGSKSKIPQEIVTTSTDPNTPSDLPYFTMGGADDVIPEVLAGRVVAADAATLSRVLKKWMDYEKGTGPAQGWAHSLGVASNQKGSLDSDLQYVTSVQDKLHATYGTEPVTLFQGNADSTPTNFNQQLAGGAMWVTYVGHGSGIDWPSFGTPYELSDIALIRNAEVVKPVWIDVACLNGTLEPGAAGATLTSAADSSGAPTGVTAYLGGTVLVSWDPPAIFARGVAFEMAGMVQPILGEVIQAGQRYLTENTSNALDIASNQRWYHLQGDPSMRLRLK